MKVAFLDDYHHAYKNTTGTKRIKEFAEVVIFNEPITDLSVLKEFDALVATRERTKFTKTVFSQLPNLRIIAQTGNHIYHFDMDAARQAGVQVGKASGGFCGAAGELTFGLMMAVMRQISNSDREIKAGGWPTPMTYVLHGKKIGIVGFGKIGRYVANIAQAFGMEVLAWGSRLTAEVARESGVRYVPLDDLLAEADIVSIHATLNASSRGLIDDRRIRLMKPTAYLINTARGPIVDEAALVSALQENRIAGAGLDVFDIEPLPNSHVFRSLNNVVLTPHLGWPTDVMYEQFANAAADILLAFTKGEVFPQFDSHF